MTSSRTAKFVAIALFFGSPVACSSATDSGNAPTAAEAEALAFALSDAMSQAVASSALGAFVSANRIATPDSVALGLIYFDITLNVNCPEGGAIVVTLNASGSISDEGTGTILISGRETFNACAIGPYVLHGDPYVSLAATFSFLSGNLSSPATMSIGGAFRVTGERAFDCPVLLTVLMYANGSGRISGQACGQGVDKSY